MISLSGHPWVRAERLDRDRSRYTMEHVYRLTNSSDSVVDTHLLIIVRGLPADVRLKNASGTTRNGEPYIRVFLPDGVLQPGQRITQRFAFSDAARRIPPTYGLTLLSGQGEP